LAHRFREWLLAKTEWGKFPHLYTRCSFVIQNALAKSERQQWPKEGHWPERELFPMYWEEEGYDDRDIIDLQVRKIITEHKEWKKLLDDECA
jgi:hypothetical protein